jgi:DNA-binding winged helix-turn-helix (wHTH) protein
MDAAALGPRIVFDVLAGEVTLGGEVVQLPKRELEVFANLAVKGRHVPYDALHQEIWGGAGDDHAKLTASVRRLRKRLGARTVRGVDGGYVLAENVTCTLAELAELAYAPAPPSPATLAQLDAIRLRHRRYALGAARHWPWYGAWAAKIEAFVESADVTLGYQALAQYRYAVALERAHDAIALNALSQPGHELALRVLIARGNVVAARQLLGAYEATLRRTLGIGLPESLERITHEIVSQPFGNAHPRALDDDRIEGVRERGRYLS